MNNEEQNEKEEMIALTHFGCELDSLPESDKMLVTRMAREGEEQ